MPEIRLLDSSVINLIAAGEVVDRPASAVKEMVENAIDAGAKHVSVEIRKGGLSMIRISDDGCGMSAANARKAFLKHATSKIATEEDLNRIATLGFRGEALAAISAVSKVTLTTKEAASTSGTRFEVSEGEILSEEECGCPDGSVFTVQDLFFNTPARLKFMKSEPAEAGAVQAVMERLALSHPDISFRFISNGTDRLHTPGSGSLTEAVFSVFGKEFAEMSLKTDVTVGEIRVSGIIGKPIYSKANRSRQIFFLNGRHVRSPILTSGLENAYHNKMLIGRAPVCVLFVELPTSQVDVNVHPSKLEVKFADENAVAYAVRKAAEKALSDDSGIVEMQIAKPAEPTRTEISPIKKTPYAKVDIPVKRNPEYVVPPSVKVVTPEKKPEVRVNSSVAAQAPHTVQGKTPIQNLKTEPKAESAAKPAASSVVISEKSGWTITAPAKKELPPLILNDVTATTVASPKTEPSAYLPTVETKTFRAERSKEQTVSVSEKLAEPVEKEEPVLFAAEQSPRIIGEAFHCYILVEKGEEILFVDKHALHERMNFERIRKSHVPSQSLLQPIVIHLGIDENRILSENADFLSRFGFLLESFGDDLLIREIPAMIDPEEAEPLLQQFADSLAVGKDDTLMDRFYYDIACKASIRSGSKTTLPELQGLVTEYFRREKELQYCPHGRPIVFSLTRKSIEKQFKRLK